MQGIVQPGLLFFFVNSQAGGQYFSDKYNNKSGCRTEGNGADNG